MKPRRRKTAPNNNKGARQREGRVLGEWNKRTPRLCCFCGTALSAAFVDILVTSIFVRLYWVFFPLFIVNCIHNKNEKKIRWLTNFKT